MCPRIAVYDWAHHIPCNMMCSGYLSFENLREKSLYKHWAKLPPQQTSRVKVPRKLAMQLRQKFSQGRFAISEARESLGSRKLKNWNGKSRVDYMAVATGFAPPLMCDFHLFAEHNCINPPEDSGMWSDPGLPQRKSVWENSIHARLYAYACASTGRHGSQTRACAYVF